MIASGNSGPVDRKSLVILAVPTDRVEQGRARVGAE
jgi:hypothetical protein